MFTIADLKRLEAEGFIRGFTQPKEGRKEAVLKSQARHKYGAERCEVDGIKFDSKKEANRYKELKMLLKAGHIAFLELQKEYELNEGGTHSLIYKADFVYVDVLTGKPSWRTAKDF